MDRYSSQNRPGLAFELTHGRISFWKSTLELLDYPEYLRFLFSPEDLTFGVEVCGIDDEGAARLPKSRERRYNSINSLDLVRFVYQTCGWKEGASYRVRGDIYSSDSRVIYFDLKNAQEIRDRKAVETNNE